MRLLVAHFSASATAGRRLLALSFVGVFGGTLLAAATAGAQALPQGWAAADIGAPAVSGSSSFSGGLFTISAAGSDIWGAADQFRYVYRQLVGDGVIEGRIASVQRAHDWTKAGLMIR